MDTLDGGYQGPGPTASGRDDWFKHFQDAKTDFSVQEIFFDEELPTVPLGNGRGLTQISFQSEPCPSFTGLLNINIFREYLSLDFSHYLHYYDRFVRDQDRARGSSLTGRRHSITPGKRCPRRPSNRSGLR